MFDYIIIWYRSNCPNEKMKKQKRNFLNGKVLVPYGTVPVRKASNSEPVPVLVLCTRVITINNILAPVKRRKFSSIWKNVQYGTVTTGHDIFSRKLQRIPDGFLCFVCSFFQYYSTSTVPYRTRYYNFFEILWNTGPYHTGTVHTHFFKNKNKNMF